MITHLVSSELQIRRIEFQEQVRKFRKQHLHQAMGILSTYFYAACKNAGALTEEIIGKKKIRTFDEEALLQMVANSEAGDTEITTTVMWTETYLQKYWPLACRGARSIRWMRKKLQDSFGLFNFESQTKGTTTRPPELKEFKIIDSLLLFEALEIEVERRFAPRDAYYRDLTEEEKLMTGDTTLVGFVPGQSKIDALPFHKAGFVRSLFLRIFGDSLTYNREPVVEQVMIEPDAIALPEPVKVHHSHRAPKWRRGFKLSWRSWQTLSTKKEELQMFAEWAVLDAAEAIVGYVKKVIVLPSVA